MNYDVELCYIEASDQTLINRFIETRRLHPLSSSEQSLGQAIAQERILMEALSDRADLRVDTSHTHVHEFRALIAERVARRTNDALSLQVCSFGYKNGVPSDANFYLIFAVYQTRIGTLCCVNFRAATKQYRISYIASPQSTKWSVT